MVHYHFTVVLVYKTYISGLFDRKTNGRNTT